MLLQSIASGSTPITVTVLSRDLRSHQTPTKWKSCWLIVEAGSHGHCCSFLSSQSAFSPHPVVAVLTLHHHPPGSYSTWTCTEKAAGTSSFLPLLLSVAMSAASCFIILFRAPSRLSCPDLDPLQTPILTPGALLWLSFPHFLSHLSLVCFCGISLGRVSPILKQTSP